MSLVEQRPDPAVKVLVVEDEPHICDLLSDMLAAEGFEPHCVTSDQAAYEALRTQSGHACLILDVNLGTGTTGYDIARFARRRAPSLPVIFVSGQSSAEAAARYGVTGSHFLPKPFTAAELMGRLRVALGDNDS
jgi:two-component system, cell cycle response regulator CpdR